MLLLIGEIVLCLGILYCCLILLAARNPQRKGWFTSAWMLKSFHIFFTMGFLIFGLSVMIKALTMINSIKELVLPLAAFVVLLAATILIIKAMRIKERLAAYDALQKSMEIIATAPASPPEKGLDDHPPIQKAA